MPRAEQLTPPVAEHGEGPVWDAAGAQLLSVDMERGVLVRYDPATGRVARHRVADVLACLRPRTRGGWVVAAERRFAVLEQLPTGFDDADGDSAGGDPGGADGVPLDATMLPPLWERGQVRFNEGACDPQGRFWVGSMAYDHAGGGGRLWRLDVDGSAHVALPEVSISNGLVWTGEDTAWYVDTPTRRVDVLVTDPATGAVLDRRPFVTLPEDAGGVPDGLARDVEGGLWVALWGAGAVRHYDAGGQLLEVVEVPTSHTTACTFGGPDLTTLYVTTSTQGLEPGREPGAGALFAHEAGVAGAPVLPYAG